MAALGLLILGAFVGYIITYALKKVGDWTNPVATLTGILSAAVAGTLFAFMEKYASIGESIFYYPIGLGYGALCNGLEWVAQDDMSPLKWLHLAAFAAASVAIVALMFSESLRGLLP